jgi:hypothetical protein
MIYTLFFLIIKMALGQFSKRFYTNPGLATPLEELQSEVDGNSKLKESE